MSFSVYFHDLKPPLPPVLFCVPVCDGGLSGELSSWPGVYPTDRASGFCCYFIKDMVNGIINSFKKQHTVRVHSGVDLCYIIQNGSVSHTDVNVFTYLLIYLSSQIDINAGNLSSFFFLLVDQNNNPLDFVFLMLTLCLTK